MNAARGASFSFVTASELETTELGSDERELAMSMRAKPSRTHVKSGRRWRRRVRAGGQLQPQHIAEGS